MNALGYNLRVEIFESISVDELTKKINDWLIANNDVVVVKITQSSATYGASNDFDSSTVISIWYKPNA